MFPYYAHSKGGRKRAAQEKAEALEKYQDTPLYCQNCQQLIEIPTDTKVSRTVRKGRKFCSRSCAAIYNNRCRTERPPEDTSAKEP